MRRWGVGWLALGAACLPDVVVSGDAGFALVDAPAAVCGHRDTPCCPDAGACRAGAVCREGMCRAAVARCVATGIANPEITNGVDWDAAHVPGCLALPPALLDPMTPGFYEVGDRGIGVLECEGLPPGPRVLRVRLQIRMLATPHESNDCQCSATIQTSVRLVVNGGVAPPLDALRRDGEDGSCRFGVGLDEAVAVTVPSDGHLTARLDLEQCERRVSTRCLFVRGTSMMLEPP